MASTKPILIDQLTVGMFIAGLDQPWYRTPFLLHKWLVSNPDDIVQLKRHGIQVVTIDTDRGLDVGAAPAAPAGGAAPIDVADQLRKLAELRDQGILSEDEFTQQKQKLLGL